MERILEIMEGDKLSCSQLVDTISEKNTQSSQSKKLKSHEYDDSKQVDLVIPAKVPEDSASYETPQEQCSIQTQVQIPPKQ